MSNYLLTLLLLALFFCCFAQERDLLFLVSGSNKFGSNPTGTFKKQIKMVMDTFTRELKSSDTQYAAYWGKKPTQARLHEAAPWTTDTTKLKNDFEAFLARVIPEPELSSGFTSGLDGAVSYSIKRVFKRPEADKIAIVFIQSRVGEKDLERIVYDEAIAELVLVVVLFTWPQEKCHNEKLAARMKMLQDNVHFVFCDQQISKVEDLAQQVESAKAMTFVFSTTESAEKIGGGGGEGGGVSSTFSAAYCRELTCKPWFWPAVGAAGLLVGILGASGLIVCLYIQMNKREEKEAELLKKQREKAAEATAKLEGGAKTAKRPPSRGPSIVSQMSAAASTPRKISGAHHMLEMNNSRASSVSSRKSVKSLDALPFGFPTAPASHKPQTRQSPRGTMNIDTAITEESDTGFSPPSKKKGTKTVQKASAVTKLAKASAPKLNRQTSRVAGNRMMRSSSSDHPNPTPKNEPRSSSIHSGVPTTRTKDALHRMHSSMVLTSGVKL